MNHLNLDGSLFLPEILDHLRAECPHKPLFSFPDRDNAVTTVTALEFSRAAHRVAHSISSSVQPRRTSGEIVAILSVGDSILYHAVNVGMQIAGLVVRPSSYVGRASRY